MDESDLKDFAIEAKDLLDSAEDSLLELEKGKAFADHYDTIFRCFHNIKGTAGMLELTTMQNYVHELETVFMQLKAEGKADQAHIEYFLKGIDGIRHQLAGEAPKPLSPPSAKAEAKKQPAPPVLDNKVCFVGIQKEGLESKLPKNLKAICVYFDSWADVPAGLLGTSQCLFIASEAAEGAPQLLYLKTSGAEFEDRELQWVIKMIELAAHNWSYDFALQRMMERLT